MITYCGIVNVLRVLYLLYKNATGFDLNSNDNQKCKVQSDTAKA